MSRRICLRVEREGLILEGVSRDEALPQVTLGAHVEIELIDQDGQVERLAFDLVPENAADFGRGRLGVNTPLAQTILGQPVDSVVAYVMDDVQRVRIVAVRPSQAEAMANVEAQREAILKQAVERAERTNAEIFASSFSGKWGDYDPAGVAKWDDTENE